MKKIFLIIIFLLHSSNIFAKCSDGLDFDWKFVGFDEKTHVSESRAHYARFDIKSTSEKKIRITRVYLSTSDKRIVKQKTYNDFILKPFGKDYDTMYVKDLNLDVVQSGSLSCRFVTSTMQSPKPKANSQNTYTPRPYQSTSWGFIMILAIIMGIIIFFVVKFDGGNNVKNLKSSKKKAKVPKDNKVFYSDQYGWSFPGKYVLLALPALGGLVYFDHGFLKFIFGLYLLGCVIGFFKGDK